MKLIWKALRRYWYVPLIVIGGIVAWVVLARFMRPEEPGPLDWLQRELDIIMAGTEADRVRIEMGTDEAIKHVHEKYADRVAKLTEKQQTRAAKLEKDPEALARFIVRGTEP